MIPNDRFEAGGTYFPDYLLAGGTLALRGATETVGSMGLKTAVRRVFLGHLERLGHAGDRCGAFSGAASRSMVTFFHLGGRYRAAVQVVVHRRAKRPMARQRSSSGPLSL